MKLFFQEYRGCSCFVFLAIIYWLMPSLDTSEELGELYNIDFTIGMYKLVILVLLMILHLSETRKIFSIAYTLVIAAYSIEAFWIVPDHEFTIMRQLISAFLTLYPPVDNYFRFWRHGLNSNQNHY